MKITSFFSGGALACIALVAVTLVLPARTLSAGTITDGDQSQNQKQAVLTAATSADTTATIDPEVAEVEPRAVPVRRGHGTFVLTPSVDSGPDERPAKRRKCTVPEGIDHRLLFGSPAAHPAGYPREEAHGPARRLSWL